MPLVPDSRIGQIEFYEAHNPQWTAKASSIGLTAAQMTTLTSLTNAARAAFNVAEATRNAAKSATQDYYAAVSAMANLGSSYISQIRAKAETTNDPTVYSNAQIPPRAAPTPAGPPTNATNVTALLENNGNVQLNWRGTVSQGQFFSIWRKLAGQTTWTQIGSVAAKSFTDTGVPAGTTFAYYQIKSHRNSQVSSGSEPVVLLFGAQTQSQAA
jgi:hypothetical protein